MPKQCKLLTEDDRAARGVERLSRKVVRAGLRTILGERSGEWSSLWVRYVGGRRVLIDRSSGTEVSIELDRLPPDVLPLVECLLAMLDEQAWMARVANEFAKAEIRAEERRAAGRPAAAASKATNRSVADDVLLERAKDRLKINPHLGFNDLARRIKEKFPDSGPSVDSIRRRLPNLPGLKPLMKR